MRESFRKVASASAEALGSAWMFAANAVLVLVWLGSGPMFGFSDTWQLWMNTFTTVVTYLAVFLIQNTQNRDSKATQLKLDELISSLEGARNRMVDLQSLSDDELNQLEQQFQQMRRQAVRGEIPATQGVIDS